MAVKIYVYIDTGNVFTYEVEDEAKAREHAAAIIATGYRSIRKTNTEHMDWFPPHRINKVTLKLDKSSTSKYFDEVVST